MTADTRDSFLNQLTDSGMIKFLGGLALGLVMRSVGSLILDSQAQQPQKGKGSKKTSSKSTSRPAAAMAYPREELKMVLCVNTSLNMGKGKIGAQCAHAAVGVISQYRPGSEALFRMWERCGQPKIALKIKDQQEMAELASKAVQMGLPAYIVHDAGRTQIAAGSQTVLAIGPGYKSQVNEVTGHLSLL